MIEQENPQPLIEQFLATLQALPEVEARLGAFEADIGKAWGQRADALIDITIAGASYVLLVETKRRVFPRDVRDILWQLKAGVVERGPALSLLLADSISPGAKDLLRGARVGYFDSGGSLYVPAAPSLLYIDKPPSKAMSRTIRSLFSGRRSQVLHALLARHRSWFGVKEMARDAMVSAATASEVLSELEHRAWASAEGQGPAKKRRLSEPGALLDAWAAQRSGGKGSSPRRYYVPSHDVDQLLERLARSFADSHVEYALTHEAAAQRYAPYLSSIAQLRCRVLAGASADAALGALGARPVAEGFNLAIIDVRSPGELLLRERRGDIWLASPVQVYLDLLTGQGRAKEMAEHLRKERIGF